MSNQLSSIRTRVELDDFIPKNFPRRVAIVIAEVAGKLVYHVSDRIFWRGLCGMLLRPIVSPQVGIINTTQGHHALGVIFVPSHSAALQARC